MSATVADLVEAQVAATPGAVAVEAGSRRLSYAELDAGANRLARHLQSLGVGPEAVVGVCLPRSVELAVALLGVLKAGGACLPLDPSLPPERLGFLVGDAAPAVVLTSAALVPRLPRGAPLLRLDADAAALAGLAPTAPPRASGPGDLAYVVYTSGSTGGPKGVELCHAGLVNHHRAVIELYGLAPGDRVLQFCSLGFDASIEELFPTWAAGATVVFRPDDAPLLGRDWLAWLDQRALSVVNLPTAYWHEWGRDIEAMGERVPAGLRLVVVGGEKALGTALATWARVGGDGARWVNAYGPTEATCMATAWEAPPGLGGDADPPIGTALPNVALAVVDRAGAEVGEGEAGELLIGGVALARGYRGDPALSARRFVADPDDPTRRWYRTGDMVRRLAGGALAYQGRLDHQVKIRGYRVECGEVEAALARHPAVAQAVVVAREDGDPGDRRLVAYVVPAGEGGGAGAASLRRFLLDRLPAAMGPAAFVHVDALPTTSNGKVARAQLPPPGPRPGPGPGRPPGSVAEKVVAAVWSEVLGVDVDGVEDDFFELGGDSLLASQAVARLRDELGTATPLRAIFEASTVAALAEVVEAERDLPGPVPAPLAAGDHRPGAVAPLSLAQEQMWRLERAADRPGIYNVTVLWDLAGPVDVPALRRALAHLTQRHEALRTAVVVADGSPVQLVGAAPAVPLTVSDVRALPAAHRRDALARAVARCDARPFDLAAPPLWRAHLVTLDDGTGRLAVTFDHVICDGSGALAFLDELAAAYGATRDGRWPSLPPLPLQPADAAVWQRRHVTEAVLADQLAWWARALAGAPLGPAIPFDRLPAAPTGRIGSSAFTVGPDGRGRLATVARRTRSTEFVVAAAALAAVAARWAGVADVVLSTTLSGRGRRELEGLVGMFSGIGRIRTDLSGDPPFHEAVLRTREHVLGMFEHQDVPFMRIRRRVWPAFPTGGLGRAAALPLECQYFRVRPGGTTGTAHFRGQLHPCSVAFVDDGTTVEVSVSYKLDFYDPATADGLAADLARVLARVGRDPTTRLSALPVAGRPPFPSK